MKANHDGDLERIHLSMLREVDRQGSLTAAARSLGLTQSALSHTVRKLEQQLGTRDLAARGTEPAPDAAPGGTCSRWPSACLPAARARRARGCASSRSGERGTLRIGMECHPCYQWLLKVVAPYLRQLARTWIVDVKQKFQFGGIGALFGHEIDMLVTPDPLRRKGLRFEPVFDYEQVLVVGTDHPFARRTYVVPRELERETLITYPVELERLDIYSQFLCLPDACPSATRRSRRPTSCCRWWRAAAASPRCRAGWWRSTSQEGSRRCRASRPPGHRQADLPRRPRGRHRGRLHRDFHRARPRATLAIEAVVIRTGRDAGVDRACRPRPSTGARGASRCSTGPCLRSSSS